MAITGKRFSFASGRFVLVRRTFANAVDDCIRTERGSQALNPGYGSKLIDLVDAPGNKNLLPAVTRESATALRQALPEARLVRTQITTDGQRLVSITCQFADGQSVVLNV